LIVYFDTSALLPLVVEERSSAVASRLWDEADRAVSSRLAYVEGRAALAQAHRMGRLTAVQLRAAVDGFEDVHGQLDKVEVTPTLVGGAGAAAEEFGLRGYDAVHLASARLVADSDLVFAAGDRRLVDAVQAAGIATVDMSAG
jgi:predicted nucleic acid-binding protein